MISSPTDAIKDELSSFRTSSALEVAAQLCAAVRMAGCLHTRKDQTVLDIAVDRATVARCLAADITFLYGYAAKIVPGRGPYHHLVRVNDHPVALARQSGLIDTRGRYVRGMANAFARGGTAEAAALLRGAFLTRGEVSTPRRGVVTIPCPSPETALALLGAGRRIGVAATAPPVGDCEQDRLWVRGHGNVGSLLVALGANASRAAWDAEVRRSPTHG